jgi:dTDP-4-amino-4,6-dideoxygalactose transaminase
VSREATSHPKPKTFWEDQGDFLPFSRPSISEEAIQEVVDCLRSGWITTGPRVAQFEADLSTFVDAPHVLSLTSATAGLYLSLQAIGLQPGDEVITTPLTFVATLNVIACLGAKPVLVDIDPHTYNIDLDQIEARITPKTKAIMPVHFAGLPVDMDRLNKIAEHHGLRVIEDAAHAIGSTLNGRQIGSFGDVQVFSFHATKTMTTGEGGAIATRDFELAKRLAVLRFHGIDRPAWDRFSKKGSLHYDVITPATKSNITDLQAAIGIHQLRALDTLIGKRRSLVQRYQDKLGNRPYLTLPPSGDKRFGHSWHIFAPCVNESEMGMDRDTLMKRLKELNIGTGLHYLPAHLYSCYQDAFGYRPGDFPAAEEIGQRILSLPLFPDMTYGDQDRVIDALETLFSEAKNS